LLQTELFDRVYLDYDLYDADAYPLNTHVGTEVTQEVSTWLEENLEAEIVIHSLNASGALQMASDCAAGGCTKVSKISYLELPFYSP